MENSSFMVRLMIINNSKYKRLYTRNKLRQLAEKIICSELDSHYTVEIGVTFCDDTFIRQLNKQYRKKDEPTDVLSFPLSQTFPKHQQVNLGDIVISLETLMKRNNQDRDKSRAEMYLLFVHGLLHLLGYTHDTHKTREVMMKKQAEYLEIPLEEAWIKEK